MRDRTRSRQQRLESENTFLGKQLELGAPPPGVSTWGVVGPWTAVGGGQALFYLQ